MSKGKPAIRRLLVVTESLGVGGTESHLIRTLPGLAQSGWCVGVFCLTARGELADRLEIKGVKVISSSHAAVVRTSIVGYAPRVALAMNKLYWLMRKWRPQIAHFYLPAPYLVGGPVAIAMGTPIKVMSRRSLSDYQQNWPMVRQLEGWLHQRMDVIVGNSRAVVSELLQEGVPEARARLIYNGIDTLPLPARKEARAALGIDNSSFVGAVVANLLPYKGHDDLIEALSMVERELPFSWCILVAGRDCGIGAELQSLALQRGVSHRVRFLGQYLDVPQLLAAADFGLLTPYGNEGFSNSILEAMSASLPMIVTDVGGNAEAVLDGETGFVVPPRNAKGIADAIVHLARSPELRARFGMAARKRVEENFTLDHCIQCHLNLYEELLDKLGTTSGTDSRSSTFSTRFSFGDSKS